MLRYHQSSIIAELELWHGLYLFVCTFSIIADFYRETFLQDFEEARIDYLRQRTRVADLKQHSAERAFFKQELEIRQLETNLKLPFSSQFPNENEQDGDGVIIV